MVTLKHRAVSAICALLALIATPASVQAKEEAGLQLFVESGIRHSARAVAVSGDGRLLATSSIDRVINIWDASSGQELVKLPVGSMTLTMAFLPGEGRVAGSQEDGVVSIWDVATGQRITALQCSTRASPPIAVDRERGLLLCADPAERVIRRWRLEALELFGPHSIDEPPSDPDRVRRLWLEPLPVAEGRIDRQSHFSASGRLLLLAGPGETTQIYDVSTGRTVADWPNVDATESFDYAPSTGRIATVGDPGGPLMLWSWNGRSAPKLLRTDKADNVHAAAFSPDGQQVVYALEMGDVVVQDAATGAEIRRLTSRANRVDDARLSGETLEIMTWPNAVKRALDLKTGGWADLAEVRRGDGIGEAPQVVLPDGLPPLIKRQNDRVDILNGDQVLASVIVLDKTDTWVVTTPDGRFDTNADLSDIKGVHWVAKGRALQPRPLEIFLRDYYEPRLLPRLLQGADFPALPAMDTLNQAQPRVTIQPVRAGENSDEVVARVSADAAALTDGDGRQHTTAAYDLRLFRDGQLVARWPAADDADDEDRVRWRNRWKLARRTETAIVKIPTGPLAAPVVFTAYAFNEDRVKSATARQEFRPPRPAPKRPGKAYVITIGVNGYEAPERTLSFAVRDAEALQTALGAMPGYEVVPIRLTSGTDRSTWRATRANIREVLARLAGAAPTPGALAGVTGAEALARATPDDLVIVTFSGHGYADEAGSFYLLPSDSGEDLQITPAALAGFISSRDLAAWLRPVDAGQLALIIDACHSAGVVDRPGFKAGPLGDRGLGQLAYDKGMRVLAASQADNVALESANLQQGLLTYALREGLTRSPEGPAPADRNKDGRVTLAEWLRYGERRTPGIYADIRAGRLKAVDAGPVRSLGSKDPIVSDANTKSQAQTPALFDFARGRGEVSLSTGRAPAPTL